MGDVVGLVLTILPKLEYTAPDRSASLRVGAVRRCVVDSYLHDVREVSCRLEI